MSPTTSSSRRVMSSTPRSPWASNGSVSNGSPKTWTTMTSPSVRRTDHSEEDETLLDRQREQILADCQAEIGKHEYQADYDRRSIQKFSETIKSQQQELRRAQAEERRRQDHQLPLEQLLNPNCDLREAHHKSLNEMEELKWDTIARRRLVEDRDTILQLTAKIQELQNEVNCMNDSRDFQDAESVRSGHSHVTSQPMSFPPHPIPEGMLSRSFGVPSRREGPPSILGHTWYIGKRFFANPDASSSAPDPQELNQWNSSIEEPLHSSTVERVDGKNKIRIRDASPDRQPKIHSSPVREILQRIMEQTNNDCRFRIFTLTNSLHQPRLLAGR